MRNTVLIVSACLAGLVVGCQTSRSLDTQEKVLDCTVPALICGPQRAEGCSVSCRWARCDRGACTDDGSAIKNLPWCSCEGQT